MHETHHLLILRHAKSSWQSNVATDFERPLNNRGKRDAPRIGRWLIQQGLIPDYIVSSPAKRANKTVTKVCAELELDNAQIRWDSRIYEANIGDLLRVLSECPESAKTVMLVGHNPGLELLTDYLCPGNLPVSADGKLLPTAALALIEVSNNWNELKQSDGRLISITHPKHLP